MMKLIHISSDQGNELLLGSLDQPITRTGTVTIQTIDVDPSRIELLRSFLTDSSGAVVSAEEFALRAKSVGDTVERFIRDMAVGLFPREKKLVSEMYDLYAAYCTAMDYPVVTKSKFSRRFKELTGCERKQATVNRINGMYFIGVGTLRHSVP